MHTRRQEYEKTRRWSTDGHIESKSIVVTGFRLKTPHGASLLQTVILKVINGLYTPFGSPVIGGQKPYD